MHISSDLISLNNPRYCEEDATTRQHKIRYSEKELFIFGNSNLYLPTKYNGSILTVSDFGLKRFNCTDNCINKRNNSNEILAFSEAGKVLNKS